MDSYPYRFDRFLNTQEDRELSTIFADYGDHYNPEHDPPEPGIDFGLGNMYFIKEPVHLVRIAMNLSRVAPIRPVDTFIGPPAIGWTTGLTTVSIKMRDLLRSCMQRIDGETEQRPVPELVKIAETVASPVFRKKFCESWPAMIGEYPFLRQRDGEPEDVFHNPGFGRPTARDARTQGAHPDRAGDLAKYVDRGAN